MGEDICELCHKAGSKGKEMIYEDEKVVAVLAEKPAAPGHMVIFPKHHHPIIEQVPDDELEYAFQIANRMSVIAFEALGAKGTNIIVNNGIAAGQKQAHFSINVIPRNMDDNLGIAWEAKQMDEEAMSTVELALKNAVKEMEQPKKEEDLEKKPGKIKGSEEENYLIKHMRRIP